MELLGPLIAWIAGAVAGFVLCDIRQWRTQSLLQRLADNGPYDLEANEQCYTQASCLFCDLVIRGNRQTAGEAIEDLSRHDPDCIWRRAVELTRT